jgi:hypothetical protein
LNTIALIIAILMFIIGIIGTILPALPGVLLIFAGMLVYGFMTGFAGLSIWFFCYAAAGYGSYFYCRFYCILSQHQEVRREQAGSLWSRCRNYIRNNSIRSLRNHNRTFCRFCCSRNPYRQRVKTSRPSWIRLTCWCNGRYSF